MTERGEGRDMGRRGRDSGRPGVLSPREEGERGEEWREDSLCERKRRREWEVAGENSLTS